MPRQSSKAMVDESYLGPPAQIMDHEASIVLLSAYLGTLAVDMCCISAHWHGGGNHEISSKNVASVAMSLQTGTQCYDKATCMKASCMSQTWEDIGTTIIQGMCEHLRANGSTYTQEEATQRFEELLVTSNTGYLAPHFPVAPDLRKYEDMSLDVGQHCCQALLQVNNSIAAYCASVDNDLAKKCPPVTNQVSWHVLTYVRIVLTSQLGLPMECGFLQCHYTDTRHACIFVIKPQSQGIAQFKQGHVVSCHESFLSEG